MPQAMRKGHKILLCQQTPIIIIITTSKNAVRKRNSVDSNKCTKTAAADSVIYYIYMWDAIYAAIHMLWEKIKKRIKKKKDKGILNGRHSHLIHFVFEEQWHTSSSSCGSLEADKKLFSKYNKCQRDLDMDETRLAYFMSICEHIRLYRLILYRLSDNLSNVGDLVDI